MRQRLFVVLSALLMLGTAESAVTPAGKCNAKYMLPVPLDIKELSKYQTWKMVYVPKVQMYQNLREELAFMSFYNEGANFKLEDKKIMKDMSHSSFTGGYQFVNNVIIENSVDENNNRRVYYNYPLAVSPEDLAVLIYRCSDVGTAKKNTRYIVMPEGNTLTKEGEEYLLTVDRSIFNNSEPMMKLP